MIDEGSEKLILVGSFFESIAAMRMPRHNRHILKVTFSSFIADGAVVGVVDHQPFNDSFTEGFCFGIINGEQCAIYRRSHARHDELSMFIVWVFELFHSALSASSH
jgi:hypothetical protein